MTKSLPNAEEVNNEQFLDVIRKADPELYMIKIALEETGVNALVIPNIIRSIANLNFGSGFGEVQIIMREKIIMQLRNVESVILNEKATKDES